MFDLDGIYNSENDRIWVFNWEEANRRGKRKQKGKFAEKVMVWSEGVVSLILFEKGTLDHHQESNACCSTIQEQSIWKRLDLPTRQRSIIYSPRNVRMVFPTSIDKNTWPANSPDLNPVFGTNLLRPSTGIIRHRKVH